MHEKDIGRLVVVDRNKKNHIQGIISKHDILRAEEIAGQRPID